MIVQIVRSRGGRFLKLDDSNDTLVDVDDEMALTKTLQALRDTVPTGLQPNDTLDGNKTSTGRKKTQTRRKNQPVRGSHDEQVTAMPPPHHTANTYSEDIINRNHPNGEMVPSYYTHASEKANFLSPDPGRQGNYSREYDTRSLIPPPGFQQRGPSTTTYPRTDPSFGSSFTTKPLLDTRSNMTHIGFQPQNMAINSQRQMQLQNQSQMALHPGYHQHILSNQHQRHLSRSPPSVPAAAGPSYHSGQFLNSSINTMTLPTPPVQQPTTIYTNRIPTYASSMRGPSSYNSGQYFEPVVNASSVEFQPKVISYPRAPTNFPFPSTTALIYNGNPKEEYRNPLVDRYYPSPQPGYNPNVHTMARPMQTLTHLSQPMKNVHETDGNIHYNSEMTRLAFLPPRDFSASNAEDIHFVKDETHSATNVNPQPSFDEKYVPV